MRLSQVQTGHSLGKTIVLKLAPLMVGAQAPDMVRILFYRPRFFGKPMGLLTDSVMRGSSDWSVGERELFAAYVSQKNRCRFCKQSHVAIAVRAIGADVVNAVLEGEKPEALGPKVLAMLPFLEKLTAAPDSISNGDLFPLRQAGISDSAIADAGFVCMLFCSFNRIADSLDCALMEPRQLEVIAKMLHDKGYDL
jgi:uncharacterized peroxidase-related enzyme